MIDRLHHSPFAIPDLSVPRTVRVRSSRRAGGR
jgi:hypothetical protein